MKKIIFVLLILNISLLFLACGNKAPNVRIILGEEANQLIAQAKDPDGDSLSYQWFVADALLANETESSYLYQPEHSGIQSSFEIKVEVSDGSLTASDSVPYSYYIANRKPAVEILPGDINLANNYGSQTFTVDVEDPDGDDVTFQWYVDNVPQEGEISNSFTFSEKPSLESEYRIRVDVTDNGVPQEVGTDDVLLTIRAPETALETIHDLSAQVSDSVVFLSWTDPLNPNFHHVSLTWEPDTPLLDKVVGAGEQWTVVSGLNNGTEYTFSLRTVDASSIPRYSEAVNISAVPNAGEGSIGNITITFTAPDAPTFSFNGIPDPPQLNKSTKESMTISVDLSAIENAESLIWYIDGSAVSMEETLLINAVNLDEGEHFLDVIIIADETEYQAQQAFSIIN